MKKFIKFLCVISLCFGNEISCIAQVNTQDSLALVDLYNSTNGGSWYKNTGWLAGPVSNWYGVSVAGGRVNHLILDSNNLVGPLPSTMGNLSGLTEVSMYQNQLNDSIPTSFASLTNLTNLVLSDNLLIGSIPSFLGDFSKLVQLDLTYNQLKGPIPVSLGNLSNLQNLAIGDNNGVTGGIPNFIGSLTNLTYLDLSGEQVLGGTIPDTLRNLKKLQVLKLGYNELTGAIPSWLPDLPVLSDLELQFNQLKGGIPSSLGSVASLIYLDLSQNYSYGGLAGSIPTELGNLSHLTYLDLSADVLTGSIPASLGNLSNLTYMDLGANEFNGTTIPSALGNLSSLTHLALDGDSLTGNIPTQLGNLSHLSYLDLNTNDFTGGIPASFGNLTAMTKLYLNDDNLSDTIPSSLGNLTQINYLFLDNNKLTGSIPASLGNMTQAGIFELNDNLLTGTIPSSLGNLTQATYLFLNYNQLSGTIPASFGNLTSAALGNNQLTGPVPAALGKMKDGVGIGNNKLNFDSLEQVLTQRSGFFLSDTPQAPIPLHLLNNRFSVSAGGTLTNDTFHWYKDNVLYQTIVGDSALMVTVTGKYSVQVSNKIITPATGLILFSDTLNSNGTTPITIVSFTGKEVNYTSLLQWQSTNEINTSYFSVQRSRDGINFTGIGKVKAAGNSVSPNNYSFTDKAPANGIDYYRLKETDADGTYTYSKIIAIQFNKSFVELYPNPAYNSVTINLLPLPNVSMLLLYDVHGKLMMKQSVESNTSIQTMDISKLAAGAYYIIWQQENIKQVLKVVKQ